jgi:hypothetical protein
MAVTLSLLRAGADTRPLFLGHLGCNARLRHRRSRCRFSRTVRATFRLTGEAFGQDISGAGVHDAPGSLPGSTCARAIRGIDAIRMVTERAPPRGFARQRRHNAFGLVELTLSVRTAATSGNEHYRNAKASRGLWYRSLEFALVLQVFRCHAGLDLWWPPLQNWRSK